MSVFGWFLFLCVAAPTLVPAGIWISEEWPARARRRRAERLSAEDTRERAGWPRHERCGCATCAQWRAMNQERLRAP